ncbi:MAG: DUF1707 domain-containing protein [Propionibacteriales bacterium]|nr:DUF1707 domain-containing protein [Propionibacteriales bacterium]
MSAPAPDDHEQRFSEPTDVGPSVGGDAPVTTADVTRAVRLLDDARRRGRLGRSEHAERVTEAHEATILDDLTVLTRDLPDDDSPTQGTDLATWPTRPRAELAPAETVISTVLGDVKREGQWRIGAHTKIKSVMGDITLDLTEAIFDSQRVEVELMTVFGDLTVRVPPGMLVTDTTHKVMSDSKTKLEGPTDHTLPEVIITGTAIMSDITTTGPKLSRRDKKLRRMHRRELY